MTPTDPLETFRAALERTIHVQTCSAREHRPGTATQCRVPLAEAERLAALATPRPAGVDVERLARAMNNVLTWHMGYQPGQDAGKLAREYAVLTGSEERRQEYMDREAKRWT